MIRDKIFTKNNLISLIGISMFFVIALIYDFYNKSELRENMEIKVISIKEVGVGGDGYVTLSYSFSENDKKYDFTDHIAGLSYNKCLQFLLGKNVPVAYSRDNPDNHMLLIFENDFKTINRKIPDTSLMLLDKISL